MIFSHTFYLILVDFIIDFFLSNYKVDFVAWILNQILDINNNNLVQQMFAFCIQFRKNLNAREVNFLKTDLKIWE